MKTIPTILILTLTTCSNQADKQTNDNSRDTLVQVTKTINTMTKDTLKTSGNREYINSANKK